jgi:hypothetical protein
VTINTFQVMKISKIGTDQGESPKLMLNRFVSDIR